MLMIKVAFASLIPVLATTARLEHSIVQLVLIVMQLYAVSSPERHTNSNRGIKRKDGEDQVRGQPRGQARRTEGEGVLAL